MSKDFRLSYNTLKLLHVCERKFQLDRLLTTQTEKQHFPATVLGTAWGAGVAVYLLTKDIDKAMFTAWLSYFPKEEDNKRTETICLNMLKASVREMDNILEEWEVILFDGKPAVEMSFRINLSDSYYYVGYIDLVLKNKYTGKVAVLDAKTTSLTLFDLSPVYQNSDQCIGYSIIIDKIVGEEQAEYDVLYLVGRLGSGNGFSPEIKLYTFHKTLQDRLQWFISLGMDVNHLIEMKALNIYPQRGDSCLQYNRPCPHFGTCNLHTLDIPVEQEEDTETYQFSFDIDDLVEDHINRIEKLTA